ncbi:uncharacterized protein LOC131857925 [Cryptomeria japonica]|uniref:uncharacterized protein LOC131857925 n=1 Tax=Cryptomeria japonica TaxID=3369 RepID=UPI0027DA1FBF|nr:uncharacterized protein LOC131857925 [Cryptomeria japonica]
MAYNSDDDVSSYEVEDPSRDEVVSLTTVVASVGPLVASALASFGLELLLSMLLFFSNGLLLHPFPRLTGLGESIPPLEEVVDDDDDEGGPGGRRGWGRGRGRRGGGASIDRCQIGRGGEGGGGDGGGGGGGGVRGRGGGWRQGVG